MRTKCIDTVLVLGTIMLQQNQRNEHNRRNKNAEEVNKQEKGKQNNKTEKILMKSASGKTSNVYKIEQEVNSKTKNINISDIKKCNGVTTTDR